MHASRATRTRSKYEKGGGVSFVDVSQEGQGKYRLHSFHLDGEETKGKEHGKKVNEKTSCLQRSTQVT